MTVSHLPGNSMKVHILYMGQPFITCSLVGIFILSMGNTVAIAMGHIVTP